MLRKWRMVPRHNISTILVESVFGGILWGKEFSHVPTTVVGTVPGGPFLMSRMAPRTPQEPPKGGRFDSPSLWNPSPTDQGRGTAVPLPWNPPWVVLFRAVGPAPALRSGGWARRTPRPLQSKAERSSCFRRTATGSFQRGATAVAPLWSFKGESEGGNRNPPSGFLRGGGGILCRKECPQKALPAAAGKWKQVQTVNFFPKDSPPQIFCYQSIVNFTPIN